MLFLKFVPVFVSGLLLASEVLAFPSPQCDDRVVRRQERRQSHLNHRLQQPIGSSKLSNPNTVYSSNWAGALWDEPNGTFTSVTGTFTVPMPSGEDGAAASVWVGIDGDTCASAILQTGIDFSISQGQASYDAWYEWYPDSTHDFTNIVIAAGNVVRLTVTATTTTSGTAKIENLTNGQTVSKNLTSTSPLCEQNAEWIVEDFAQSGGLAPFANFSTVTFTNAQASGGSGIRGTPSGATVVNIEQNGKVLTSVEVSQSSLAITYV